MSKNKEFKILAVDDQKMSLDVLVHILKEEYIVYPAKSGEAALKRAVEVNPDLIMLDVVMPDMSGFEVIEKLKEDDLTAHIPVIFISAMGNDADETRGMELGAVDFVKKPYNKDVLKKRVETQITIIKQQQLIDRYNTIDEETGVLNRKGFDRSVKVEWARAMREKTPISLMMIGADCAHDEKENLVIRDKVVPAVTARLKRATDTPALYKNNAVTVILPNTPENGAVKVAENICKAEREWDITLRIGISTLEPAKGDGSLSLLVFKAENSLFKAKNLDMKIFF